MTQFNELGLGNKLVKTVAALGYDEPTPIQHKAIPLLLEGRDVLGLAQTGTGKTAAFSLPLLDRLMADKERPAPRTVRSLILSPTRELVNQITDNIRGFMRGVPLRVVRVVGGASINPQINALSRGADVLVATPGRLIDLLERRAVFLDETRFLVLDEADQMLDLGFIQPLRKIESLTARERQTVLFSATMPKQIESLADAFMRNPVRVEASPPGRAADKITQSVHFIEQTGKVELLIDCLNERPKALSLVFARTKHGAERLMKQLTAAGFAAASVHGNKSQGQRERAIQAFRAGKIRVLVATDVAARGIDIPGVTHVYNFELPEVAESYVHRIGRTARAGADGEAIAFCAPAEQKLLRAIQRLMKIDIPVASGEPVRNEPPAPKRGGASRGRPRGAGSSWAPKRQGAKDGEGARKSSGPSRSRPAANGGARGDQSKTRRQGKWQGKRSSQAGRRERV